MSESYPRVRFLLLVLPLAAAVSFLAVAAHWSYTEPTDAESILIWALGWVISVIIQILLIPALLWVRPYWANAEPSVFRVGLLAPLVLTLGLLSSVPFLLSITTS